MKKHTSAILCLLWSGFFCLFAWAFPAGASAYGSAAGSYTQSVSADFLADLARQKIEDELNAYGETRRHDVQLAQAPSAMSLPAGEVICEVELPQGVQYDKRTPVHIRVFVGGRLYRRAICYYEVKVYDKVLAAARDLPIDKPVAPGDVRAEERRIEGRDRRYIKSFEEIQERVPARVIRAGTAVEASMLQNPIAFETGAPVTIKVMYQGIEVRAEGVAMQRGRIGASVRVRNARSGKVLHGTVVDAATVEIKR